MATPVIINAGQVIYAAQTKILELANTVAISNSLRRVDGEIRLIAKLVKYIETLQNDTSLTFSEQQAICQCMISLGNLFDFPVVPSITAQPQTIIIGQPGMGPQGPPGPIGGTGPTGPQGIQGPPGDDGTIAALTTGKILIGVANVPTEVTVSGDISIGTDGIASIGSGVVVNADINSTAAIALSKLAASTVDKAAVFGSAGFLEPSATSKAQIGFLSTVTSDVQVQIAGKQATITGGATTVVTDNLTANRVLVSNVNGKIAVATSVTPSTLEFITNLSSDAQAQLNDKLTVTLTSPADGDVLYRSGGVFTNRAAGSTGQVLTMDSSGLPVWDDVIPANGLPIGGVQNQILIKSSSIDFETEWSDLTLSFISDVSATAAEVNVLSGITSTTAQLNYSNTVTSNIQSQINNKLSTSLVHNALFVGNSSNIAAQLSIGSEGQVLTVAGGSPTWLTISGTGTVTSIDVSGGTTGLLATGGPISTSGVITLSGNLIPANGGTGITSYSIGDLLYASSPTALTKLSAGTNGQVLTLASGVPAWASGGSVFESDITLVLSGSKSFGKYTNGQTAAWTGMTVIEALEDAMIEYVDPVFTSFSVTGQLTTVEVGTTITGSKTFTWAITENSGNVNTIDIYDSTGAATLAADTPNDGSHIQIVTTRQLSSNGSTQVWRGIGTDATTTSTFNSGNFTVTARYYRFLGPTASSPITSADVRALPTSTFHTGASNFVLATGSTQTKFVVALPPTVTITSVIDEDALFANITSNYVLTGTVNVLDAGGTNRAYNIYEMNIGGPYSSSHSHRITTAS